MSSFYPFEPKYPPGMSATSRPVILKLKVIFLVVVLTDVECFCFMTFVSSLVVARSKLILLCIRLHAAPVLGVFATPLIPGSRTNP